MNPYHLKVPAGSIEWGSLMRYAEGNKRCHKLDIQPQLPPDWSVKIGHYQYSEMWLRLYAFMRHFHACTVLASDYANKTTEVYRPIVRCRSRDLKLLEAHTRMAAQAKKPVRRRYW